MLIMLVSLNEISVQFHYLFITNLLFYIINYNKWPKGNTWFDNNPGRYMGPNLVGIDTSSGVKVFRPVTDFRL